MDLYEPAKPRSLSLPSPNLWAFQVRRLGSLLCDLANKRLNLSAFTRPGVYPNGLGAEFSFSISRLWFPIWGGYARLSAHAGWTTISTDGPQLLPASSGGVTAYKFRDPEGHPLELIAFPPGRTRKMAILFCNGMPWNRSLRDFSC